MRSGSRLVAAGVAAACIAAMLLGQAASRPAEAGRSEAEEAIARLRANEPQAYEAVVGLGEEAVDGLVALMRDEKAEPMTRYMAINALGDIGSRAAVKPLLAALDDPQFNIRRCAALALGKLADPSCRAPLMRLAASDPFAWEDPDTRRLRYLVREDARTALAMLDGHASPAAPALRKEKEIFLPDAAKLPPLSFRPPAAPLPWPFPGGFRAQNLFNNYQQPTDAYVHGGLDLIQDKGTEVRAVEDGFVTAMATNYPEWKTHHFFIVTRAKDGHEGWCYTHMDPDSYTFKLNHPVKRGQVLGKLVDFYVGKDKGTDHLHLQYVRFSRSGDRLDVHSLADPLMTFEWEDTVAPAVEDPIHFVRAGTLNEFRPGEDGIVVVKGRVDIVAGISDRAYEGQACNWGVPVITLEIEGEKTAPWRKLVLDQRGPIATGQSPSVLYVSGEDSQRWMKGRPRFPAIYWVKATHTDGDGVIEEADRLQCWDTRAIPDGQYEVIVRAWDLKGNLGTGRTRVQIVNRPTSGRD